MPDLDTLRRLVRCRSWRWMGGARWVRHRAAPLELVTGRVADRRPRDGSDVPADALPDPTDPATVGCLEAIAAEIPDGRGIVDLMYRDPLGGFYGLPGIPEAPARTPVWVNRVAYRASQRAFWTNPVPEPLTTYDTKADALIAAIIAADAAGEAP